MEGYVVSTVAGIDQPLKPSAIMARNESRFFAGLCEDDRESLRTAVLEQKVPGIKNLAGQVSKIANNSPICVIGNLEAIKKSEMFDEIVEL